MEVYPSGEKGCLFQLTPEGSAGLAVAPFPAMGASASGLVSKACLRLFYSVSHPFVPNKHLLKLPTMYWALGLLMKKRTCFLSSRSLYSSGGHSIFFMASVELLLGKPELISALVLRNVKCWPLTWKHLLGWETMAHALGRSLRGDGVSLAMLVHSPLVRRSQRKTPLAKDKIYIDLKIT